MATMEMEWNLKTLAQLFRVSLLCLQKSAANYYDQCSLNGDEILFDIVSITLLEHFVYE